MEYQIDSFLDTSGLCCPEPVMLLHKHVRNMHSGELIKVLASDPSTTRDIPKFCHFLGHELLFHTEENGCYQFIIKKE